MAKRTVNINQTIWKILQSDIALQKDVNRKIVNTRALAKYLIKKYALNTSLDSVISAVRRFETQEQFAEEEKVLSKVFKDAVVSTKNNVSVLTLSMRWEDFTKRMCTMPNNKSLKCVAGSREVKLMAEQPDLEFLKEVFSGEVKSVETGLSEISIKVSEKAGQTKGVLARLSGELALANINLHEVIVCPPEILLYVRQKDIVTAHDSILKLCQEFMA